MRIHKQGREFPVFERDGMKFGIVICADAGYIEPTRILALKGAKVIFSPHYNYIRPDDLLRHFHTVRADHVARSIENRVYFVRGNNVNINRNEEISSVGVGYGDSYRSRRHQEDFIFADIDPSIQDTTWGLGRSLIASANFTSTCWRRLSPITNRIHLWVSSEDGNVKVFVNGRHVPYVNEKGERADEYSGYAQAVSFDITSAIKPNADNQITNADNQITIVGTRTFINELGTGGLLGPVYLYREK